MLTGMDIYFSSTELYSTDFSTEKDSDSPNLMKTSSLDFIQIYQEISGLS